MKRSPKSSCAAVFLPGSFGGNDIPDRWLAMYLPGMPDDDVRWFHFFARGEARSACANHQRPIMALVATKDVTPKEKACPRCVEAFTFAGKTAPEFPQP